MNNTQSVFSRAPLRVLNMSAVLSFRIIEGPAVLKRFRACSVPPGMYFGLFVVVL